MINLQTGQTVEHRVYGSVELTGFNSVADEVDISVIDEDTLDPIMHVQEESVEFVDQDGSTHTEPLTDFYKHALK